MKNILLLLIFVLSISNCASAGNINQANSGANASDIKQENTDKPGETGAKANANQDIRKIDFKNFTYNPFCVGEEPQNVTVKDGEFLEEKQEDGYTDRFSFTIFSINYGDINDDGNEDAVILSNCNTGGTGQFTEGFVYELKDGKPSLVTRIPGGDRAYGGLVEAKIENGLLVVDSNDVGEQSGACCPEFSVTSRYKITGGKLSEVGKSERRELYPAQKVSFPKGATSTTLTVKFAKEDDRKRFSLSAKKGQIMRVTSPDKIFVDLHKGDAEASDKPETGFTAVFNKDGEIVIEVQFFTDAEKEVSVTMEIQ